jgi:hypothetical protein
MSYVMGEIMKENRRLRLVRLHNTREIRKLKELEVICYTLEKELDSKRRIIHELENVVHELTDHISLFSNTCFRLSIDMNTSLSSLRRNNFGSTTTCPLSPARSPHYPDELVC